MSFYDILMKKYVNFRFESKKTHTHIEIVHVKISPLRSKHFALYFKALA